jgi:hypothetical protein
MKVNLKKLAQQKLALEQASRIMSHVNETKRQSKHLKDLIRLVEEIEQDLEMAGESIVELDKGRLESIEERNKMLMFFNNEEEI